MVSVIRRVKEGDPGGAVSSPAARRSSGLALPELVQATLAVRLLVVAALVVLYMVMPGGIPARFATPLVAAAVVYAVGITLYGAASPDRAERVVRWALAGDVVLLCAGMLVTTAPVEFVLLSFPLVAVVALLLDRWSAGVAAAALLIAQMPPLPSSMFTPAQWFGWTLLAFALLATGAAAAAAAHGLAARGRLAQTLAEIDAAVSSDRPPSDAAGAIVRAAAAYFRADAVALAMLDPATKRLETMASRGGAAADLAVGPEAADGIAGWVAQGGRAVLLTPGSPFPLRLPATHLHSSICAAAAISGRPAGVLILHRGAAAGDFSKEDLEHAEVLAAAATPLLLRVQNDRTLAEALTALAGGHAKVGYALTRDPVVLWPALLDLLRSLTSARVAVLALEHEYTGNVEIVAARGVNGAAARSLLPPLIAATTMGERQRADAGAIPGVPAMTCVPLSIGTRTIGALGLDAPEGGPFSGTLLAAVAAHIAAAVDTARTAQRVADIGAAEERRRIAREMHDGLAQTLANALLQTDLSAMAAQSAPADLGRELRDLRGLLEHGIREIREFMAELRRTDQSDGRLLLALERLAGELERQHRLAITVSATGDDAHLPPAVRHALLAIARQALANVQAHARATAVTVRAAVTDELCTLDVVDNGIGFDVHAYRAGPDAGHHLGLPSMEERAALIGGRLTIESAPNRGTTVAVRVPLGVHHG